MRDAVCIVEIRQDLLATLVVGAADLGKADFARAAVEQSHAEPCLERMNVFGNGARAHAKGATGRGKATSVDDPHEGRHACCAVHQSLRLQGQRDRFAPAYFDAKKMGVALRRDFRLGETCCNCNATTDFLLIARALARRRSRWRPRKQPGGGARHRKGRGSLLLHAVNDGGGAAIMAKGRGRHCQATRQCPGQLCRRQRMMDKLGNPGGRQ